MSVKNPSKFKGAGTRKDKHTHCKTELSVELEEFHKVVAWLLKQYTSTANVAIKKHFFVLKLTAKLLCINKKGTA